MSHIKGEKIDENILSLSSGDANLINEIILRRLWADDKGKDLSFIVEDKPVRCHRWIVLEASEYFERLLDPDSGFSEKSRTEIPVVGVNHDLFCSIIQYFYTNDLQLDENNVWNFMEAAEMFMIDALNQTCMEYIKTHLTPESCWNLLSFTRTFKWKENENKTVALEYIGKKPSACKLQESKEYISMTEWKFMIETAVSEENYSKTDNDIILGELISSINDESVASVEGVSVITDILQTAVPLFEKFVEYGNAVNLYSLGWQYGCLSLKNIAIEKLKDIWKSKDLLCSVDKWLFDCLIEDLCNAPGVYLSSSHFAGQCGDVILTWIKQNNTGSDHLHSLYTKYSYQLSNTICRDNVMDVFRMARSCGSSVVETSCLSFIDKNISSLMHSLVDTSVEEIQCISNFYLKTKEFDYDYRNLPTKAQAFVRLVENDAIRNGDEKYFPSLNEIINNFDAKWFIPERRLSANTNHTSSTGKTFGKTLEMWIKKNKEQDSETVQSCIDTLIDRHSVDIGYNLSSENIYDMYFLALKRNQRGLEAVCFSFILKNFGDLIIFILNLPFQNFLPLVTSISKLYKGDIRVQAFLGLITTCWMAPVSEDFKHFACNVLEFPYLDRLCKRDDVNESTVLSKLEFLIVELLNETDINCHLSTFLMISTKLNNKQPYTRILERCIQKFPKMITEKQFAKISEGELSKIIASDYLRHLDAKNRQDISETDIIYVVISWCAGGDASGLGTMQHVLSPKFGFCHNIFPFLRPPKKHLMQLLNFIESSPCHLEDEHLRGVFLLAIRQFLPRSFKNVLFKLQGVPNTRRKEFVRLMDLLRFHRVPFTHLLDVFEQFPFLLNDESLRIKFLKACRHCLSSSYGIYLQDSFIPVLFILSGIVLGYLLF